MPPGKALSENISTKYFRCCFSKHHEYASKEPKPNIGSARWLRGKHSSMYLFAFRLDTFGSLCALGDYKSSREVFYQSAVPQLLYREIEFFTALQNCLRYF
jgi:hypothetical protein